MRAFWVGLVGGLVALVGFAGTASALFDTTISLIWADTGTSSYTDPTGSIVLNVVVNTGPGPSTTVGGSISVDYSAALGELTFFSAANAGAPDWFFSPLGVPLDTGTQVQHVNAVSLAPQPFSTSVLLGTITFTVTAGAPGTFNLITLFTGFDDIEDMDLGGGFGTASITRTPEPGTLSLLVMGLGGLYAVGRRQRR
jgi:hypothetical protein